MSTDGNTTETNETESKPEVKLVDLIKEHPNLQNDLNAMMKENRVNLTKQNQELVKQLEEIKRNASLTAEQRDELQGRITQLEEQYLTKEELAKREANKTQKEYEQKLEQMTSENEQWKNMFAESTIRRSWQDAAMEGEVLEQAVGQIADMFKSKTSLVQREDTGQYEPVVKFDDTNDEGKNVILDLSPQDAIKRMKELPNKFGYLFKGTATSGIGGSRSADGSAVSPKLDDLINDPVKYAEWRKNNPDLDLSKLRR